MEKIELTEEELQAKIDEAVKKASADLEKEHSSQMYNLRNENKKKVEEAVKKAVEESKLTQEELAKKQLDEQLKEKNERLAFLEAEHKKSTIKEKLMTNGVPLMFVNDTRLLNAKEEDLDSVVSSVKEEFLKLMPSGSNVNTNVNVGGGTDPKETEKERKFKEFAKLR